MSLLCNCLERSYGEEMFYCMREGGVFYTCVEFRNMLFFPRREPRLKSKRSESCDQSLMQRRANGWRQQHESRSESFIL